MSAGRSAPRVRRRPTAQSPAGSYLITAPAVTAQWQRHLRRLRPRSTFSQQTTCDRPVHGQGGKRPTNAGRAGTASIGRIDLIKGGQISMNASWEVP